MILLNNNLCLDMKHPSIVVDMNKVATSCLKPKRKVECIMKVRCCLYYCYLITRLILKYSVSSGMDAQVSYAFHSERKMHPEKFKNQLVNQVLKCIEGLR